jgi:prepilin-type N-terminal cleavage/methylation domain-containing protein
MSVEIRLRAIQANKGVTLVELVVVVAIIGILAALAIPVVSMYGKEAGMSEATANLQGIMQAEQVYFTRYQKFTNDLSVCPAAAPGAGKKVLWPDAGCGGDWNLLGWKPDGAVAFQYTVMSRAGDSTRLPLAHGAGSCGVDWNVEGFGASPVEPWCVVRAVADTDGNGVSVTFCTNSYNNKTYRSSNDEY